MAKRLQVVLNRDVSKLGRNGDLVEVAPGYARNYLIPQGVAVIATPGILKQVEQRREKERQQLLAEKQQAESRKTALETIGRFVIHKQVGEGKAIFGTVTAQEVAEAIKENANQDVDRRGITLPDISETGFYQAEVKLHSEVTATIEIQVAPQKGSDQ
ncbi:MAG: 50S ribosomal protein L9 [Cyanophyceae cyanobacterium]